MNTRVIVLKKTLGAKQDGYRPEQWIQHGKPRWAEMITTGGREFYAAQKVNEETTALFKMHYTAAINTSMRLKVGNRIFEIIPPLNDVDGKHQELWVSAKEIK